MAGRIPTKLIRGMRNYKKKPVIVRAVQMHEPFHVATMEGLMTGKAEDYLVIGLKGELYPVDKEIFSLSYEETEVL
jgi:hypothetical protein